jgi:hypothetical protein
MKYKYQSIAEANLKGEPKSPPKSGRKRIRLSSHEDIASELRRLHRLVENGEITAIEAVRQSRVLAQLATVMTAGKVQRRLDQIEQTLVVERKMR